MKAVTALCVLCLLLCCGSLAEDAALPWDRTGGSYYLPADPTGQAGIPSDTANLVVTGLPVLDIRTLDGTEPDDETRAGSIHIWEADAQGALCCTSAGLNIRLRGNTSRRYPKKSFRVSLTDAAGDKQDLSIAGLRRDDDWILNPMYSDTSKIREALAYSLWEKINSCGTAAQGSRMAFCEVLLNGEYRGLYAAQERMDRQQVRSDRKTGILYKIDTNYRPTVEALLENGTEERCEGIELAFAGSRVSAPWLPVADYLALLEGCAGPGAARLSMQNAVDYTLWAVLTQARDCHYKNQFLHAVRREDGSYELFRIPWDLNHTFGDYWSGSAEEANYTAYSVAFPAVDDVGMLYLDGEDAAFQEMLAARWQELRETVIREDALTQEAEALFRRIYPAVLRDTARWPQCGMGEGNSANVRDITGFIRENIRLMDQWIQGMADTEGMMEETDNGDSLDRGR